jgi:hypothetical protein
MSNKILKFADFKNGNPLQEPKKHALTTKGEPKPKKEKSFDQVKRSNLGQLTVTQPAYSKTVKDPIMEGVIEDDAANLAKLNLELAGLNKLNSTDESTLTKIADLTKKIADLTTKIDKAKTALTAAV